MNVTDYLPLIMIVFFLLVVLKVRSVNKKNRELYHQHVIQHKEQKSHQREQRREQLSKIESKLEDVLEGIDFLIETRHLRHPIKSKKKRLQKKEQKRVETLTNKRAEFSRSKI